jgi:hypothetical protein
MNNTTKIALAAALVGGYVLGRAKKGRLAFAVATYLAGRRFGLEPQQLLTEGLRRLQDMPQFEDLNEQVRGGFKDAGRKALTAAADRKFAELADSLHERTARIGAEKDEDSRTEAEDEEEEEYEPEAEEEPEGEEEEEKPAAKHRRPARRPEKYEVERQRHRTTQKSVPCPARTVPVPPRHLTRRTIRRAVT